MRLTDLDGQNVTIWGLGREGQAAAQLVLETLPDLPLTFIDENPAAILPGPLKGHRLATTAKQIEAALELTDILIKSPGVSLYHPLLEKLRERGGRVSSLFNLWCGQTPQLQKIAVTGTKGKSTTASLLTHVLTKMGRKAVTLGNIGTPVNECPADADTVCVIEVSSYQAADFESNCAMGLLVSLYPEHLNWHGTVERYYADKANLLAHCQTKIITAQAQGVLADHDLSFSDTVCANDPAHFRFEGDTVWHDKSHIGMLANAYLARAHNKANVCAVLSACAALGL
ncbi:MAG: Mur ligase family protein, partial [Alphaproteobacteria bacterium]|nr:Mur ligase family protein [Alphaproteobacteria bacterium]